MRVRAFHLTAFRALLRDLTTVSSLPDPTNARESFVSSVCSSHLLSLVGLIFPVDFFLEA